MFSAFLCLAAAGAAAASTTTLTPIVSHPTFSSSSRTGSQGIRPSSSVTLSYGLDSSVDTLVNVNLAMKYDTVLLEEADAITVSCSENTVVISFEDQELLQEAQAEWKIPFVLITNHLAGCDVESERGMFLANELVVDEEGMKATVSAEKSAVGDVACK